MTLNYRPSWKKFKTQFGAEENPAKPVALAPTQMNDFLYNMGHPSRGKCLIFNHSVRIKEYILKIFGKLNP